MSKIIRTSLFAAAGAALLFTGDAVTARADLVVASQAPRILNLGGSVVASPKIVPVFFPGSPLAPAIADFLPRLAAEPDYAATLHEYGVGTPVVAAPVNLTEGAPLQITTADVGAFLAQKLADPSFPQPDGNTVYTILYPPDTEIDHDFGNGFVFNLCLIEGADHDSITTPAGVVVPFVAAPQCDLTQFGLSGADALTLPLSMAIAGALTNPRPVDAPAYAAADFNGSAIGYVTSGEGVGDFCTFGDDGFGPSAAAGHVITRLFSNRASLEGRDPCRGPGQSAHYFSAMPVYLDGVEAQPFFNTKGLKLGDGEQITIPIRLFAEQGAPRSWTVSAVEGYGIFGSFDPFGLLFFSFDKTTGGDGDIVLLTVNRLPLPAGASPPPLIFSIQSTANGETHSWPVVVGE